MRVLFQPKGKYCYQSWTPGPQADPPTLSLLKTASKALYHTLDKVYLKHSPKGSISSLQHKRSIILCWRKQKKQQQQDRDYVAWHFLKKKKKKEATTFLPAKTCKSQVSTSLSQSSYDRKAFSGWTIHCLSETSTQLQQFLLFLTAGHCSLSTRLGQGKKQSREPWLPHWSLGAQDLQVPTCLHPLTKCNPPGWEHSLCWIRGSGRQECKHSIPATVISVQTPTGLRLNLLHLYSSHVWKTSGGNNSRRSLCTNACK